MSAFIVQAQTISNIVNYLALATEERSMGRYTWHAVLASEYLIDATSPKELKDLAEAMFALNCRAVVARYGADRLSEFRNASTFCYVAAVGSTDVTDMQAYRHLHCWLYQCDEGDIRNTSLLYTAMQRIHAELAHKIVQSLDAYKGENWG